ncbi:MAG: hypothetical protein ABEJ22_01725 [Haloferacaceae archaeon]
MHAESLLQSARRASGHMDALFEIPVLAECLDAWRHVDALQAITLDMTTLLRGNSPLPVTSPSRNPTYESVLGALTTVDELTPDAVAAEADLPVDAVTALPQVSVVGGRVVVEIRQTASDWVPVLAVLHGVFGDLSDRATRIEGRLRADGVDRSQSLFFGWTSTMSMLDQFGGVLESLLRTGGFIDDVSPDATETFRFIEWTIERLHDNE